MIKSAKKALHNLKKLKGKVEFRQNDVLELSSCKDFKNAFDIAITERCLINLIDLKSQIKALSEIAFILKKQGLFLMCEDTLGGLTSLNSLRKKLQLPEIKTRWHNVYLAEKPFLEAVSKLFDLISIKNISSTYYMVSRVIYARLAADSGVEPEYLHPINRIAAQLPYIGDYGPLKLFVFRKK